MSYTQEEAIAELARRGLDPTGKPLQTPRKPSMLSSLAGQQVNWIKGLTHGLGQAGGDIGASILNLPAQGIEKLTGSRPYNVPHPDLLNKHPQSFSESVGQKVGANLPKWALEAYLAHRVAPMAGRNPFARIGLGGAQGAATGFAINEGKREHGAKVGGGIGLGEGFLAEYPLSKAGAGLPYRRISQSVARNNIGGFYLTEPQRAEVLAALNTEGLTPTRQAVEHLMNATRTGEYQPMRDLESNLGEIAHELSQGSGAERGLGRRIRRLTTDIRQGISENFANQGYYREAEDVHRGPALYRRHHQVAPYAKKILALLSAGGIFGEGANIAHKIYTARK
jgi:hypothetical protein